MILGMIGSPIIFVELVAASRRLRYRLAWVALTLVLLAGLGLDFVVATRDWWWDVSSRPALVQGLIPPQVLAASSARFFSTFTFLQVLAVLVLTPVYTAGAIAQEKQRRNLDLLLITDLNSAEIVFGKFAVRVVQMIAVLFAGMPVLAIAALMGGISFANLLTCYALSIAILLGMAGTCMLVSVFAERVWDAVLGTYGLAAVVFFVLPGACSLIRTNVPAAARVVGWIEPVLAANNPLRVLSGDLDRSLDTEPMILVWRLARNMAIWGFIALAVAIWQLRPAYFRRIAARERINRRSLSTRRRPSVGAYPVLWRERFAVESGMRGFIARWLMILAAGVLVIVLALTAWLGFQTWILPDTQAAGRTRQLLHSSLSGLSSAMALILLLSVSVRASISVAIEREGGTLDQLLITPLTGSEIALGKMFAAFWGVRWAIATLLTTWMIGVLAGIVTPFGPLVLVVDFAVFTFLSAAIGLHCSILIPQPVTAVTCTVGTWLVLCTGYMLIMIGPVALSRLIFVPLTPGFVLVLGHFENTDPWAASTGLIALVTLLAASAIWNSVFLALAAFFTHSAIRNFDILMGRTVPMSQTGLFEWVGRTGREF
jgi:ABC-type transport system involved in multi-copper enzyme maturation permease subunit